MQEAGDGREEGGAHQWSATSPIGRLEREALGVQAEIPPSSE